MPLSNVPDPDYIPEVTEFPKWPDGEATCIGIQWTSVARDTKEPIFVQSKVGGMVARANLLTEKDNTQGPPISVEPHEVPLLVKAFGGDPSRLPNMKADYTQYLVIAQALAVGKKVKVVVKDGWVNYVQGMSVPEGYYRLQFAGFRLRDENDMPIHRKGDNPEWGSYFLAAFKVIGEGLTDKVSPYNGAIVLSISTYGLAVEDGSVRFETRNGNWTANAVRMSKFIKAFAPEVEKQNYADPANILPEIEAEANKRKYIAVGQMKANKKGRINLDFGSLVRVDGDEAETQQDNVVDLSKEKEVLGSPALEVLFRLVDLEINKVNTDEEKLIAANPDNSFTQSAKDWAVKFKLRDKASAAGIKNFQFSKMSDADVVKMCEIIGGESWKATAEASLMGQGDF